MKNNWLKTVPAAALLAATLAQGASEPQIRVEVRGVRTLMDELQAAGTGTSLESAMPFFPLTVKRAVGVDLVNLLQGDATASAEIHADLELLDAAFAEFAATSDSAKVEEFLGSVVAVFEFVPKDVDRFWAAWERAYPNREPALPAHGDFRVFRIGSAAVACGTESGDGHAFMAFGIVGDTVAEVLAGAVEAAAADGGWTLSVPGTVAAGFTDYTAVGRAYAKALEILSSLDYMEIDNVEVEPVFGAVEAGLGLAGDILRFNWLASFAQEGLGAEMGKFMRGCSAFSDGDAVQVVDRDGARMVWEGRFIGDELAGIARRQFERQMEMIRRVTGYTGEETPMPRIYDDLVAVLAHVGNGSVGQVLMPRGSRERGLPPGAVYFSNIVDAPACREAIARIATGWPRNMLDRYCPDWGLDDGDVPLTVRLLGSRELACAEVDTYELSFPDVEANQFIRDAGNELPFGIGLVEFAWAPDSQLIVSTLFPAELDQLLVDLQDGNFRRIRDNPRFAELLSEPAEGDVECSCGTMNLLDLLRDALDWGADWGTALSGRDLRANEKFVRFRESLPDDPGFAAMRAWMTPDGRFAEEMAAPLAPLREAWIGCFSAGLDMLFGVIRDASAGPRYCGGADGFEDACGEGDEAPESPDFAPAD